MFSVSLDLRGSAHHANPNSPPRISSRGDLISVFYRQQRASGISIFSTSILEKEREGWPPNGYKDDFAPDLIMSEAPAVTGLGASLGDEGAESAGAADLGSLGSSEKNANSPIATSAPPPAPKSTSTTAPKQRSCILCRTRKVRCDKQSPCSTCRRAKAPCVFPSNDRPPRWARRLERFTSKAAAANGAAPQVPDSGAGKVMDRLRNLEQLVKELSGQLEQAHASAASVGGGSSEGNSPGSFASHRVVERQDVTSSVASPNSVQEQFGRMVVQDSSHSRYISSGFWSRVNDEVCCLSCSVAFNLSR